MKTLKIKNVEEMHTFAQQVAETFVGGEVLGLTGDLGTGKTEFVRGLAKTLGSQDVVKSPSFTLLNTYRCDHNRVRFLVHVDLYRLQEAEGDVVAEIGLDEWIVADGRAREDAVVVIEWPETLPEEVVLTKKVSFTYGEDEATRVVEEV